MARRRLSHTSVTRAPARFVESRVHHKMFLDMSARYVDHCRTSGRTESPALSAAAERFRRERSLASLIAFADLLEGLEIPASRSR
jgi:hypothetical protein